MEDWVEYEVFLKSFSFIEEMNRITLLFIYIFLLHFDWKFPLQSSNSMINIYYWIMYIDREGIYVKK